MGVRQTLRRTPLVDSGWLPKETAGRGLTSTLRPPNFEEEEPQLKDKKRKGSETVTGQAGQTVWEMESRGPGSADGR